MTAVEPKSDQATITVHNPATGAVSGTVPIDDAETVAAKARELRLFQPDTYISLDFLDKQAQVVRLFDTDATNLPDDNLMELETPRGKKYLHMALPEIEQVNAIKMELESFADAILDGSQPVVSIEDGYRALKLAYQIMEDIEKRIGALK